MRNIHKSTPSSFRRRENAAAIVKAPPPGALTKGPDRKFPGLHPPPGGATSPFLSTNRRFAFPILALLAALAVGLLFLLPGGPLQAQSSDGTIMYPENGTVLVATYTAVDPEMTAIVSWSLDGTDDALFSIEGGVLMFKKSPDYEMAMDDGTDNMYSVTVQATDETNKVGMKEVMVEVTNVDEMGTVALSALRPQSATMLTATLTDPDSADAGATTPNPDGNITTGVTWQWSKASSRNGSYTDIEDATSDMYTPVDADLNSYLRATASYTDGEGSGKSAMESSVYSVQGVRGVNEAPDFPDQDTVMDGDQDTAMRSVPENTPAGMAIGDPVVAEDGNSDILTYTLSGTDADDAFDIDQATGQLMTKGALDFEMAVSLTVTVRATDPAGVPQAGTLDAVNGDEIMVTITVTNVNEPPPVTGDAAVSFEEVGGEMDLPLTLGSDYMAVDPEIPDSDVSWSLSGADSSKFEVSDTGGLTFKAKPDFEAPTDANKNNVYEVTVVAADGDGNRGTRDVKVTVANQDEPGVVTLSRTQPRVGLSVKASLTDPDGSISGLTWQWSDGTGGDDDIDDANSDTYTPVADDVGKTLTATASYTDGHGPEKTANFVYAVAVAADTRNKPPVFVDQDTETDGVQNESTERKVEENTKALAGSNDDDAAADESADNVGGVVMAMDPDPNTDTLIYTLSGADAGAFRVRDNGQIEVAAGTKLDYETRTTYMVTVMAEDSFEAYDTIMVAIMVTDMDELPDVTGDATTDYAENGTGAVATYTAVDPELTDIVSWSLDGTDAEYFDISAGVLTFRNSPDYEDPADDGTDNMYSVTVRATDETNKVGMKEVMVEVTNVDEMGTVTLSALRPQSAIPLTASLTDPDSADAGATTPNPDGNITTGVTWQWSKASSRNGSYTDIEDAATSSVYTPVDADINSYLRATASYTDGEGSDKSAMERSEYSVERRPGSNMAPKFADDQDPVTPNDQDTAMRSVPENTPAGMAIGDPVVATDEDGDILTYTLTGDAAVSFHIDWATGQITTKGPLNFEGDPEYMLTVRATDPSGVPQAVPASDTNSDEVMVTITVTNVNEPPPVTGDAAVSFEEVGGEMDLPLTLGSDYMAVDPEIPDSDVSWSLSGADSSKFEVSDTGGLTFKAKPDFEAPTDANKNNVYEVTVVAADGDGNRGTRDVKVTVANQDEPGVVTLSRTQPRVGLSVKASLTDPDGSISGLTWQWSDGTGGDDDIDDANSDTYTPVADDVGKTLTATASYTDGHGPEKTANFVYAVAVAADTRNKPPVFVDQDTETDGVQNESTERKVEENTKALAGSNDDDAAADESADNVGGVVMAMDPDPNTDSLIYTLSGADAGAFRVRDNGQIEVAAGTKLDYETRTTYMVTVMAEDSFGASASIALTIMVTDVDEEPEIMRAPDANVAPEFASATTSRTVAENTAAGEDIGNPVAANDANGDTLTYALVGTDAASFNVGSDTGQLMTLAALDYETKATYSVTVTASDSGGLRDSIDVTITVTNEEEMGEVTLWAGADALTMAPQVGDTITGAVMDPDGGVTGESWQWAKTKTPAMMDSWMPSTGATNAAYTVTEGDTGYHLRVMATYTDAAGTDMEYSPATMMVTAMMTVPMFDSETATREVAENTEASMDIGAPVTATDADGDALDYTLGGTDAASFDINPETGQLKTLAALDYETTATYEVMVTATDPDSASDMITVTITVTNVDEMGEVTLWAGTDALTMAPQVGDTITGAVMDPDGGETVETWQWAKSMDTADMSSWMPITGATNAAYVVMEGDTGYHLRVMATYTDAAGTDTAMVYSMPTMMVTAVGEMMGEVTLWAGADALTMAPQVGETITGAVMDPDGGETVETWQWAKSMDG